METLKPFEKRKPKTFLEVYESGLVYTDPNGIQHRPRYSVVPIARKRRTRKHTFIGRDDSFIQDMGLSSETIKLKLHFVGSNHLDDARGFEKSLARRGYGILELPSDVARNANGQEPYRRVIPVAYTQTIQYIEAVNRTSFEVTFHESVLPPGITLTGFLSSGHLLAIALASVVEVKGSKKTLTDSFKAGVLATQSALKGAISKVNAVKQKAQDVLTAIDTNLALITSAPAILFSQVQTLMQMPLFPASIDVIHAYDSIIQNVTHQPETLTASSKGVLNIQTIYGTSALTVMASKVADSDFSSRTEAVDAFDSVKESYVYLIDYLTEQEERTAELPLLQRFVVDPELYESLYLYIQQMTGRIDQVLLGLSKEVTLTIEQDTTTLNLAAKHYPAQFAQDPNGAMAALERTNEFTGDDYIMVPKGTEIKVLI